MRLIDADAMADSLEYDVELDARALDSTDLVGPERERVQFDKDCKQNCMWYLTEQATIPAPRWYRVEEPPKENGRYLVTWEGVVTTEEYKNGVWLYASMFNQRVTHWMPLPEPPKEECNAD